MASPNRQHWPSMFRSKHASQLWQPQPDMGSSPPSLVSGSTGCSLKSHFSSGAEERSTDPKPRWSPRPEQIRILEAIFNSGMVNPPRDEIPRIRMRLQEYGQVGDANVFYWFQNRKSRSKNKLRTAAARVAPARACAPGRQQAAAPFTPRATHPKQLEPQPQPQPPQPPQHQLLFSPVAPTSSSSSSSDRSSGSSKPVKPTAQAMSATAAMDLLSPLAAACQQQMHYQLDQPVVSAPAPAPTVEEFVAADIEPICLQWPQGHCLSAGELAAILGAQYMQVPVQQPPAASPAGMLLGLCNELAAPSSTVHRSGACGAELGQYWPSCNADQPSLGKICAPLSTPVSREEAHDDATKLGMLQYGFGISTAPAVYATSAATILPTPASPEPAVTVASAAPTTPAGLISLPSTTLAAGAVTYDHLQGAVDGAAFAGTGAVARGAAVVCVAGTSAVCSVPATHLDVRMCFGEGAVLVRCDGERAEPLLVDESSGLTVEPLQHGGIYYCVFI